ncbi:AraC family transcriptional regulator [Ralstonia soli]|uniref:AraC family transcriptional regulator n=1 Tax=Ralstonia soli TaxID=2953896 RepID=A0ABT1AKY7_9RALS|nr:AraC family transcriptional regulator [Ralstonia soli]MCO5399080.1 AraC family transcriptional regulator [Ralstonia soli]
MPLSPRAPVLTALYRNPLFRSDVRVEAHEQVALELADHVLRWKAGVPDAAMFKGQLNRLRIYALRYGAEVEVSARPFDNFALVHTSLGGGAEIECDGHRLWVAEGRTAVLAPKERIRLRWSPGNQQMIVKVPHSLLHEAIAREETPMKLVPGFLMPRALEMQWELLAHSLLNLLSPAGTPEAHSKWVDQFERHLASFLLLHQPEDAVQTAMSLVHAALPSESDNTHSNRGARQMDAVIAYIESHLCAPVSLEDLARVACVSSRTLNTLCRRYAGIAPMELLRNARLDAVRSRLLLDPSASITETALAYGFGHLGRFAAYYAARFNELPSDTQRRRD